MDSKNNNENKIKLNIGFDIGITSVGWSIVDDDYNIIDMGVRLFDDVANPKDGKLKNAKRRESRSQRRRISRTRLRKQKYIYFLIKHKWIKNDEEQIFNLFNIDITKFGVENPIELKVKALNEEISKEALIYILFHYLHHRGFFYELDDEEKTKDSKKEKKDSKKKKEDVKNTFIVNHLKTPSENILEFYEKNNYYKNAPINDEFSNEEYINEVRKILKKQSEFNNKINDDFINEYIDIFKSIRSFTDGPGMDKYNLSNWSKYKRDSSGKFIKDENNNYLSYDNIWEKTIGKCTYYPNENRGYKKAPKTLLFGFLNDLSNFKIDGNNLTKEYKEFIMQNINKLFESIKETELDFSFTLKKIYITPLNKKFNINIDEKESDISGIKKVESDDGKKKTYKISDLDKYIQFACFIKRYELFNNSEINYDLFSYDEKGILNIANNLFIELAKLSDYKKRRNLILQKMRINDDNNISEKINNDIDKLLKDSSFNTTSSLSFKAMDDYNQYVLKNLGESVEQNRYFYNNEKYNNLNNKFIENKYIPTGLYDDAILSPTVRRAFNQNIAIMNAIIKKYLNNHKYKEKYEINRITLELPRDSNSKKEAKKISKMIKKNEEEIDKIIKKFNLNNLSTDKLSSIQKQRIKLWNSTSGYDIYDGQFIDIKDVISGKNLHIDHIIPYHISNMDSLDNKVLTKKENNKLKKERTPYQWMSEDSNNIGFNKFKDFVSLYVENKEKKKWLLYEGNPINDKKFIERNLVDTRYSARLVLNLFQNFFNQSHYYKDNKIKISVINGSLTTYARNNLFVINDPNNNSFKKPLLIKDRNIYNHHAIDASIVCFLGMNQWVKNIIQRTKWFLEDNTHKLSIQSGQIINNITGEIVDITEKLDDKKDLAVKFAKKLFEYNPYTNIKYFDKDGEIDKEKIKDVIVLNENHNVKFSWLVTHKTNMSLTNETIYSSKEYNGEYYKISSQWLLIDNENKEIKKDVLDEYFDKNNEKYEENIKSLLIYNQNKKIYDKLFEIYNSSDCYDYSESSDNKKIIKNPFVVYMKKYYPNIINPNFILIDVDNKEYRIKKLKFKNNKVNIDNVIFIGKNKNQKEHNSYILTRNDKYNNKSFFDSLEWKEIRIYKNKSGNYICIPINAHVLTYKNKVGLCIDENKLNSILEENNIANTKYIKLIKGTTLINNDGQIFYISGYSSSNQRIELKVLNYDNVIYCKKTKDNSRIIKNYKEIINDYYLVNIDVLGNIYNKRKIEL